MKKYFSLLLIAAALTVSCEKQQESSQPLPKGKAVEFSALSSVNTKTEYSGEVVSGKEAIKWVNQDRFTVWCDQVQAPEQKWATYRVNVSGSSSTISPNNPAIQLMWGEDETHTFYASYPAEGLYENKLSGTIPDSQKPSSSSGRVFKPQLSTFGYMVATAQATPDEGEVELSFQPMFSNLEFIVGPGSSTDVTVTGFRLKLPEGSKAYLAGKFTVTMSPTDNPKVEIDYTNASKEIEVNLGTVTIPKGETMTFPVITFAEDLKDLTAIFTIKYGEGEEQTLELPLVKDKQSITFAAGRKSRINAPKILGPEAQEAGITAVIKEQGVDDYTIDVPDPEPEP
ncbi:MAG: fimbrillin family protein [Bacteroidales bacterium]|nr:fimbrillin family protein [Bacteroidales bacterium]